MYSLMTCFFRGHVLRFLCVHLAVSIVLCSIIPLNEWITIYFIILLQWIFELHPVLLLLPRIILGPLHKFSVKISLETKVDMLQLMGQICITQELYIFLNFLKNKDYFVIYVENREFRVIVKFFLEHIPIHFLHTVYGCILAAVTGLISKSSILSLKCSHTTYFVRLFLRQSLPLIPISYYNVPEH